MSRIWRCLRNDGNKLYESGPLVPIMRGEKVPAPDQCELDEHFSAAVDAVVHGEVHVLERMMNRFGPNFVNWKSNSCQSLLHFAVRVDRLEVVQFLVENRANINAFDSHLNTVFHYGARFDSVETMNYLLGLLKAMAKDKLSDLQLERGNLIIAKRLLDDPAVDGRTPLHLASVHSTPRVVVALLQTMQLFFEPPELIKAVTRLDCKFHTPAHVACRYSRVEVLKVFVDVKRVEKLLGKRSLAREFCRQVHVCLQKPDLDGRTLKPLKALTRSMSLKDPPRTNAFNPTPAGPKTPLRLIRRVCSGANRGEMRVQLVRMREENERLRDELERLRRAFEEKTKEEKRERVAEQLQPVISELVPSSSGVVASGTQQRNFLDRNPHRAFPPPPQPHAFHKLDLILERTITVDPTMLAQRDVSWDPATNSDSSFSDQIDFSASTGPIERALQSTETRDSQGMGDSGAVDV